MFPIAAAFHPDGDKLATAAGGDTGEVALTLWEWSTGRRLTEYDNATFVEGIAFAPDGETFATAEQDGNVIVWDANSPNKVVTGVGHSGAILDLAYSPDGSRIATAGDDGTVRVFNSTTGEQEVVLRGHEYLVMGVTFSPDGTKLASASPDGLVRVWALELDDLIEIADTKLTRELTDQECRVYLHRDGCDDPMDGV